jgi:hypothetical protein
MELEEQRLDIMLNRDSDVIINEEGDIQLTDSIRQSVLVHLRWFFQEWRFSPPFGVPYFEEILVKNPDIERIKSILRDECLTVYGVLDVQNISVDYNTHSREANFTFSIITGEEIYREELTISA